MVFIKDCLAGKNCLSGKNVPETYFGTNLLNSLNQFLGMLKLSLFLSLFALLIFASCESRPPKNIQPEVETLGRKPQALCIGFSEFLTSSAESDSCFMASNSHIYHKTNLKTDKNQLQLALMLRQDTASLLLKKVDNDWSLVDSFHVKFMCFEQRDSSFYCGMPEAWLEDFNFDGLEDLVVTESYGFSGRNPLLIFLNDGRGNIRLLNREFEMTIPEYDTVRNLIICPLTGRSPYFREGIVYSLRRWKILPMRKITIENESQDDSSPLYTICLYEGRKNKWILTKKQKIENPEQVEKFVEQYWPY